MLVFSPRSDPTFCLILCPPKIIATRPKGMRKSGGRVRSPRAQVLGSAGPSPAARARYSNTAPAPNSKAPAARPATTQAADKIIVSNLPYDVNEAQIKVCHHHVLGQRHN